MICRAGFEAQGGEVRLCVCWAEETVGEGDLLICSLRSSSPEALCTGTPVRGEASIGKSTS